MRLVMDVQTGNYKQILVYLEETCTVWDKQHNACHCLLGDIDCIKGTVIDFYCHLDAHHPVEEGK